MLVIRLGGIAKTTGCGFEDVLSEIPGLDWWEAAKLGRDTWQRGKFNFVSEAVRRYGGPRWTRKKVFLARLAPVVDAGFIQLVSVNGIRVLLSHCWFGFGFFF